MNVLALSYAFPPMAFPRSIQVARLLKHLDATTLVLCASDPAAAQDQTIAPDIEQYVDTIRVPFRRSMLVERVIASICHRLQLSWLDTPDMYRAWGTQVCRGFLEWQAYSSYRPNLLLTFGQPMSDHLAGLHYKQQTGIPWIAHFSDPWVDNPFRSYDMVTRRLNQRMEYSVIQHANAVIFTSPETLDLVMRKYPANWHSKAFYLPHCYDETLYDDDTIPPVQPYTLRSLGNFYGARSPRPLFEAVEAIAATEPVLLEQVRFELVGSVADFEPDRYPRARHIIHCVGRVSYAESVHLMQTAHCLLVIDAPAETSVFFPSKLVDYIGANRFILAFSPAGRTASVVQEVGGLVIHPLDMDGNIAALKRILREQPRHLPISTHRSRYSHTSVVEQMHGIIAAVR